MKKKTVALLMAFVLVVGATISGTMAWLIDGDKSVVNTFTVGDINIELTESGTKTVNNEEQKNYNFVPGDILAKDPKVTVKAGSEACYLFVKIEESFNSYDDLEIVDWNIRGLDVDPQKGWVLYKSESGSPNKYYYYRIVDADTAKTGMSWYLLTGNDVHTSDCTVSQKNECSCKQPFLNGCVTVNENVTKDMVTALRSNEPQLKFTAVAIQSANLAIGTDEEALNKVIAKLPNDFMN